MIKLKQILKENNLKKSYCGPDGFSIISETEIDDAQLGYSVHPDGSDLTGDKDGDWMKDWIVLGRDSSLGDPLFTDLGEEQLPVYTAMHGAGRWDPERISDTIEGFLSTLQLLADATNQDSMLIAPIDEHFLSEKKREELLVEIRKFVGTDCIDYWENLFERYQEWVEESEED